MGFWSPDHYYVNIILICLRLITFIQVEFINIELFWGVFFRWFKLKLNTKRKTFLNVNEIYYWQYFWAQEILLFFSSDTIKFSNDFLLNSFSFLRKKPIKRIYIQHNLLSIFLWFIFIGLLFLYLMLVIKVFIHGLTVASSLRFNSFWFYDFAISDVYR